MTEESKIHEGDIGTEFILTIRDQDGVVVDLSAASVKKFKFCKPSGTILTKDATFVTDGKDGQLKCVSGSGDLMGVGLWWVQAYVELSDGKWHSNMHYFLVDDILND